MMRWTMIELLSCNRSVMCLGNSIAHDATIHPLEKVPLGSAMSADLIRRASTPALWCALTQFCGL